MKRILILLTAAGLLAACAGKDNVEPPAPLKEYTPTVKVERVWSADSGSSSAEMRMALVLATDGANVYAADGAGDVSAYKVATGDRIWQVETDQAMAAGPAVAYGRLALVTNKGEVMLLDSATGKTLWKHDVNGEILGSPAMDKNAVVVRTVDGRLIALSATDGHQLWMVLRDVPRLTLRGTGTPVINNGIVYAGYDNGKVFAVDVSNGQVKWEASVSQPTGDNQLATLSDVDGTLQVTKNDVYAVGYQGKLLELGILSGQPLWSRDMSSYTGVGIDADNVYVSDASGKVWAVDRVTGTPVWSQDALHARMLTRPAAYKNTVVVGDLEGYVHFLDKSDGKLAARVQAGSDPIIAPPLVVDNLVIVLNTDGDLDAFKIVSKDS